MLNELKIGFEGYIKLNKNNKDKVLPSAEDTLRQATLRLGGPSGEAIKVEDIRYYLSARLLSHLGSGDKASKDYQLLQQAQDLSSPTGVQAAIEVFKAQFESLREEFSTTPKDKRDRNLIREGLALGLSITNLEKDMLPNSQIATFNDILAGHKITSEQLQSVIDGFRFEYESRSNLPEESLKNLELLRKAKNFRRSKEGREAAVQFIENTVGSMVLSLRIQTRKLLDDWKISDDPPITQLMLQGLASKGDSEAVGRLKILNGINEKILTSQNAGQNAVRNVIELMEELEKGSRRS